MLKEVCASCLQPVYSVERVFTDKVCLHHSCFYCKVCGKKLSLQNYAALHGMFYCQVHYKQMAGAKSRRERERLEQQLEGHQAQRAAVVGRGPQPQDWYSRAGNKTDARKKPTSFDALCSLQLAEQRQELNSRSVLTGNKLSNSWPPSETALLAADGKAGKGACSWKKPTLSWQTCQAVGSRADRMVLRGREGEAATEAAMREGSFFLPGVTYTGKREQACSWPKPGGQRVGEKQPSLGDADTARGKQGGQVSQRVAAFQQGKLQPKRGTASASSLGLLEPAKSLPRGLLTDQSTKPTNWMYLGAKGGCVLPTAGLVVKGNEACGSLSPLTTPSEGGTRPAATDDKPETTTAGDKHHPGERMNSSLPVGVAEEPETKNNTNMEQKYRDEGVDPSEHEAEHQASHLPGMPGIPSIAPSSLEPGGLSASPEIAELVSERSKANADELSRKQTPVFLEESTQPSSVSHLPGEDIKGVEFKKTNEMEEVSTPGCLEETHPDHTSQENTPDKNGGSSLGLPEVTDDHNTSCLQKTEPQATYGPLIANQHRDSLAHDAKSAGKDFPVSAVMPSKGTCATWPSPDEVSNSKLKDPSEDLSGNIFQISEQPVKKSDSSKMNISSDICGGHQGGKEKTDLKHPGESVVYTSRPSDQSKETRSGQARTDVVGKGFRLGKNPFTTLFGSEDKGSTHKKEATQRKPTKTQSALVTLFGYSSEKKQSQQENPAEQTNNEDKQENLQGLLSASSQAKQKTSKNDQLPQPGKTEVIPKDTQESSEGCLDTTEGKETNIPLSSPGTNISCDDKHERTELDVHDQPPLNRQALQPQDSCWLPLMPAQGNQREDVVSLEGGTKPFYPPPEFMPAVDYSKKKFIREGNHPDAHLLESQNLLSLDVQNTMIEDEIFSSSSNLGQLPKEDDLQLHNMDLLEDNNLFLSVENKRQDFPRIVTPHLDLQNSQTGTPLCFDPNPSELCQEILAEANASQAPWDTCSLLFLAGHNEIVTRDPEGIQSCAPLQHSDPQYQAPKAAEDTFGLGLSAEGSTSKHLSMQEGSLPPLHLFTGHASENPNQNLFDPLNVDSDQTGQDAPAKKERSRKISEAEEAHESFSSADPNVFSDDLLNQEFFI